jgi:hypothetical protein
MITQNHENNVNTVESNAFQFSHWFRDFVWSYHAFIRIMVLTRTRAIESVQCYAVSNLDRYDCIDATRFYSDIWFNYIYRCTNLCSFVCMNLKMYVNRHTYIYMYIHTYLCICICLWLNMYMHTVTCVYMCLRILSPIFLTSYIYF